jgi:hypothetical protein
MYSGKIAVPPGGGGIRRLLKNHNESLFVPVSVAEHSNASIIV